MLFEVSVLGGQKYKIILKANHHQPTIEKCLFCIFAANTMSKHDQLRIKR